MTDPNHDYIPPAFAEWADKTNKELAAAEQQARQQRAQEEAERELDEFRDLAASQAVYFNMLINAGLPAQVAQQSVMEMAAGYWDHRFRMQFRGSR